MNSRVHILSLKQELDLRGIPGNYALYFLSWQDTGRYVSECVNWKSESASRLVAEAVPLSCLGML